MSPFLWLCYVLELWRRVGEINKWQRNKKSLINSIHIAFLTAFFNHMKYFLYQNILSMRDFDELIPRINSLHAFVLCIIIQLHSIVETLFTCTRVNGELISFLCFSSSSQRSASVWQRPWKLLRYPRLYWRIHLSGNVNVHMYIYGLLILCNGQNNRFCWLRPSVFFLKNIV